MFPWLLDSLFPRRCVGCGEEGSWICHSCMKWDGEGWPREVGEGVTALMPFRDTVVREAMHGLKYHGVRELATLLVKRGLQGVIPPFVEGTIFVPVPTSLTRRKLRGYNQAELIARELAKQCNDRVQTDLLRKTARGSMVGRSRAERAMVAQQSYVLRNHAVIPEVPLILVDDLCTTGSTLTACRAALGRPVPALVLAFEEQEPQPPAAEVNKVSGI